MARNNNKLTRRKKIEPAVMTFHFTVDVPANSTINRFIDLSQCASILNRRFYRQGLNWPVSDFKVLSQSSNPLHGSVTIESLPTTWVMSNAWEKGFRVWQKMNNEALEEAESVKPKFLDFKIYADVNHHDAGFAANLLPTNVTLVAGGLSATPGTWDSSKYVVPAGGALNVNEREVIATGASYPGLSAATGLNAVSLIEGYAASRGLPDVVDPNVPDDAASADGNVPENWMSALFNEGTQQADEVLEDMITENNKAPYPFENDGVHTDTMYPGGVNQLPGLQIHSAEYITATTIGGTTHVKGGTFPCGLIGMRFTNSDPAASIGHVIEISLVPGPHRGYLCEPMTEM